MPPFVRRLARILMLLALGGILGGIIGSILTGDWVYTIVWSVGIPVVIALAVLSSGTDRRIPVPGRLGRVPGISSTLPATPPAQTTAILNPEPTAVPATGMTLNGVPVDPAADAPAPAPRPPRSGVPWWNRALAVLLILVGAALALLPSSRVIGWTVSDLAQGRWDGRDMRTGLHQQEAIDDIAEVVGSYEFTSVNFYDSYVIVDAPTFPGADTTDTYQWRYGRAWRDGPEFIQPDDVRAEVFDASEIDFSVVGRVTREAIADTGWTDLVSWFPSVTRSWEGEPEIMVYISSEYHSATYRFTVEGGLRERTGTD